MAETAYDGFKSIFIWKSSGTAVARAFLRERVRRQPRPQHLGRVYDKRLFISGAKEISIGVRVGGTLLSIESALTMTDIASARTAISLRLTVFRRTEVDYIANRQG
jgi:hypothetical protein